MRANMKLHKSSCEFLMLLYNWVLAGQFVTDPLFRDKKAMPNGNRKCSCGYEWTIKQFKYDVIWRRHFSLPVLLLVWSKMTTGKVHRLKLLELRMERSNDMDHIKSRALSYRYCLRSSNLWASFVSTRGMCRIVLPLYYFCTIKLCIC